MTTQTEITAEERIRILRELPKIECFCGAKKVSGQTFCHRHYKSLPLQMRSNLYHGFGDGYEEAYTDAREWLAQQKEGSQ